MGLLGGQLPGARAAGTPSPSPATGQPIQGRSTGSNACVPATGSTSAGTAGCALTGYRAAGSSQRKTCTSPMPEATNYSCSRPVRQRARRGNGSSSTHGPLTARADTAKGDLEVRKLVGEKVKELRSISAFHPGRRCTASGRFVLPRYARDLGVLFGEPTALQIARAREDSNLRPAD